MATLKGLAEILITGFLLSEVWKFSFFVIDNFIKFWN